MNLCLLCSEVKTDSASGVVRATCDLAQALAAQGHSVHLLTNRSRTPPPPLEGVAVHRVDVSAASGPFRGATPESAEYNLVHAAAAYRGVVRIHEHGQPVDAVLAPLWRSEGAVCVLDERFPTVVSCVTSLKTLTEVDDAYGRLPGIDRALALERHALARSRYLHGPTEAALAKTVADHRLAPAATAVIGRGLRDRAAPPSGRRDGEPVRILFVGRVERSKGADTLVAAFGELLDEGFPARLTIAGPIVDADIAWQAQSNGHASAVRLTGPVTDAEITRLYAESDIVCLPSRYEAHGIAVLEAMMFGKPLVTGDAGGLPGVIDAGRNALLVDPESSAELAAALRRLVHDPGLRVRLASAARASYELRFRDAEPARELGSFLAGVSAAHNGADVDVASRFAELLGDVLGSDRAASTALAAELLDARSGEPYRRLAAAAAGVPPPERPSASTVTAVLVTSDRPESLRRALDSLDGSATPVQTIVVDNGTDAAPVEEVCAGRADLVLERPEHDLGRAGGRRRATELAKTPLVLFLDDDAELMPGALEQLVALMNGDDSVQAVTATVIASDGLLSHSGGSLACSGDVAEFSLSGAGTEFTAEALPRSGPTDWVPGTAVLVRRSLLDRFPLDDRMGLGFEDCEWSYRVSRSQPGCFRRSREALVFHHAAAASPEGSARRVKPLERAELLDSVARFYERHGIFLCPWTFDTALPELRSPDGTFDYPAARILMELVAAKGGRWLIAALDTGELDWLLRARGREAALAQSETEIERLRHAVLAQEETLGFLRARHETLTRVEQGGWWRLRSRALPLIRLARSARGLPRSSTLARFVRGLLRSSR